MHYDMRLRERLVKEETDKRKPASLEYCAEQREMWKSGGGAAFAAETAPIAAGGNQHLRRALSQRSSQYCLHSRLFAVSAA